MIHAPLTKLQCCPTSDGAAAAILVSEDFVKQNGLEAQAIEISGITLQTDPSSSFDTKSSMNLNKKTNTENQESQIKSQKASSIDDVRKTNIVKNIGLIAWDVCFYTSGRFP